MFTYSGLSPFATEWIISPPCFAGFNLQQAVIAEMNQMRHSIGYNFTDEDMKQLNFLQGVYVSIEYPSMGTKSISPDTSEEWFRDRKDVLVITLSPDSDSSAHYNPFHSSLPCFLQSPSVSKQIARHVHSLRVKYGAYSS